MTFEELCDGGLLLGFVLLAILLLITVGWLLVLVLAGRVAMGCVRWLGRPCQ